MFVETELRPQGEPAKVGTLKFSEAIRIGARIRPQCKVHWFNDGRSCALGAAYEGAGRREEAERYHMHSACWPYIQVERVFGVTGRIVDTVFDMNDSGSTREQIADWLESQGY